MPTHLHTPPCCHLAHSIEMDFWDLHPRTGEKKIVTLMSQYSMTGDIVMAQLQPGKVIADNCRISKMTKMYALLDAWCCNNQCAKSTYLIGIGNV